MYFKIFTVFLTAINVLCADKVLTQSQFIWNTGLANIADIKPKSFYELFIHPSDYINPKYVKDYDVIWIQPIYLNFFVNSILPKIKNHFILLVNTCDDSFPSCMSRKNFAKLMNSPLLVHIFSQNCLINDHQKITQIPIGLDLHTLAYGKKAFGEQKMDCIEQEKILSEIRNQSSSQRIMKACADFHHNDTMKGSNNTKKIFCEDRTAIWHKLQTNDCVEFFDNKMPRRKLWMKKSAYAFSICPPGNGLDTHRVWEDLILGVIPIVKTSALDSLYNQFPIVIINDWNMINQESLEKWYDEKFLLFNNKEIKKRLYQKYWIDLISSKKFYSLKKETL